jgi:hypothetical protein
MPRHPGTVSVTDVEIIVELHDDGNEVVVVHAPQVALFATDALAHFRRDLVTTDEDGCLVLPGGHRYRPVRFEDHGRVIVCEKA